MLNKYQVLEMATEFKTLVQLRQEGVLEQASDSLNNFLTGILEIEPSIKGAGNDLVLTQTFIAIIAAIILGITFLPFGATPASIQACQLSSDKKLLKTGGALIIIMTSISAILFLEVLKLSEMMGNI